jgi:tetratricopeptide (TPR) repeat protein
LASRNGFGRRTFAVYWYYLLRAEILLASDSASQAINESGTTLDTLRLVMPNPVQMKTLQLYNLPDQHDIIPRAYAKMGDLRKAIEAYERMIRIDPNRLNRRLINPMYHYRLAKLYEQAGDKGKAAATYSKFLEVWKNADRNLPAVLDANARLSSLKLGR